MLRTHCHWGRGRNDGLKFRGNRGCVVGLFLLDQSIPLFNTEILFLNNLFAFEFDRDILEE